MVLIRPSNKEKKEGHISVMAGILYNNLILLRKNQQNKKKQNKKTIRIKINRGFELTCCELKFECALEF